MASWRTWSGRGRHRLVGRPAVVHLVFRDGEDVTLPARSALTRAMSRVAGLLARW